MPGIVAFIIALLLMRISGRRSFGVRTAPDNIISISLGAILSRAVVGASAFVPVVVTCFVIVLNALIVRPFCGNSAGFARLMEGDKILLYSDSKFIDARLKRTQLSKEDIMQGCANLR